MDHLVDFAATEGGTENLAARLAVLESADVELLSLNGDRAKVRVTTSDEESIDVEMVDVEGRWVPVDLASQWPAMVERTRTKIEYLGTEEAAQVRVQLLFGIGVVEGFIDQIDQMENPEELDRLIGGILGNFMRTQDGHTVSEG